MAGVRQCGVEEVETRKPLGTSYREGKPLRKSYREGEPPEEVKQGKREKEAEETLHKRDKKDTAVKQQMKSCIRENGGCVILYTEVNNGTSRSSLIGTGMKIYCSRYYYTFSVKKFMR